MPVFRQKAAECQSTILFSDQFYTVVDAGIRQGRREVVVQAEPSDQGGATYSLDLLGAYQLRNLPAVLASIAELQATFPVSVVALRQGLSSVTLSTGLKGRFQTLQAHPQVIADTAHNQPGIRALLATIEPLSFRQLHLIIGFVQDKDVASVLVALPPEALYYFCQSHTPRSLSAEALAQLAVETGLITGNHPVHTYSDVNQALSDALSRALPDDLVIITGSTYLVAELTNL